MVGSVREVGAGVRFSESSVISQKVTTEVAPGGTICGGPIRLGTLQLSVAMRDPPTLVPRLDDVAVDGRPGRAARWSSSCH